uniref:Uncharacterized protein n=1 Tax=Oryza sativa subsp. japonica TaxID=39947 RepID=Q6Z2J4_ORYSJ|nr:hypothetical protein [Oryza sativa Japonica Group]
MASVRGARLDGLGGSLSSLELHHRVKELAIVHLSMLPEIDLPHRSVSIHREGRNRRAKAEGGTGALLLPAVLHATTSLAPGGVAESRTAAGRPARERRELATVAGSPRGAEAMRGTASRVRDGAACTHGRRVLVEAWRRHRFLSRTSSGVVEVVGEQGQGGMGAVCRSSPHMLMAELLRQSDGVCFAATKAPRPLLSHGQGTACEDDLAME